MLHDPWTPQPSDSWHLRTALRVWAWWRRRQLRIHVVRGGQPLLLREGSATDSACCGELPLVGREDS